MRDAFLIVGPDRRIETWNRRFGEWFGLPPDSALEGAALDELEKALAPCFDAPETFAAKWTRLTEGSENCPRDEWELQRPERRILETEIKPLSDPAGGHRPGRILLWHDVTEKRDMKSALERAQRMEAIGRLAGGIAHDINNLLTAISGNLSLALQQLESGNTDEVSTLLSTVSKAAFGGRDIVKQLLCHARKNSALPQSFDLRELITDVRGLLRHSIPPLILVEFETPKNLWPVTADRNSIQQVILNLCVNAVHAMKDRPDSRLSISASNLPRSLERPPGRGKPGVDYVRLTVRDNGTGIPHEIRQRIFEPFFTTKPNGEGTGLGLAISRDIVEKYGGWIECESKPGKGTAFSVALPRGETPPAAPARAESLRPVPRAAGRSERILVVDDDALVRAVSARLLSNAGYEVVVASDGIEALEWLKAPGHKVDLVLLDVAMPRLSGLDVMNQIRKLRPGLPVVLCTGSLSLADPEGLKARVDTPPEGNISKPYDVGELTSTVRNVLDLHLAATA